MDLLMQNMNHIMKQVYGDAPVIQASRSAVQAAMIREALGLYKPIVKHKRKNRSVNRKAKKRKRK